MTERLAGQKNRRAFLKAAAGLGGAFFATRFAPADAAAAARSGARWDDQIGVQLYTLRDRTEADLEGTVGQIAEIGYREVEFAGYFGRSPEDIRKLLEGLGLTSPSAHVGLEALREDLETQLDAAAVVGHRYVTIPAVPGAFGGEIDADAWRGFAEEFNQIGRAARKRELRLAYHNHAFEFEPAGEDETGFDILLRETDPELVSFELDLFWAVLGGHDPVALFERYPGRFPLWHVKDMKNIAATREAASSGRQGFRTIMQNMTAVGGGEIDFRRLFDHAGESGLEHFFVENDAPEDSVRDVQESYAYLADLLT